MKKKIDGMSDRQYRKWLAIQKRHERIVRPQIRALSMGKEIDDSIEQLGQRGEADYASQRYWLAEWRQDNINDGVFFGLIVIGLGLVFSGFSAAVGTVFGGLAIVWRFVAPQAHVKVIPRKFRRNKQGRSRHGIA